MLKFEIEPGLKRVAAQNGQNESVSHEISGSPRAQKIGGGEEVSSRVSWQGAGTILIIQKMSSLMYFAAPSVLFG